MTESRPLLLPGRRVSQLNEVAISKVGQQEGILVEQNAAVRQFDSIHDLSSSTQVLLSPFSILAVPGVLGSATPQKMHLLYALTV
jgi:hypothetical protein